MIIILQSGFKVYFPKSKFRLTKMVVQMTHAILSLVFARVGIFQSTLQSREDWPSDCTTFYNR